MGDEWKHGELRFATERRSWMIGAEKQRILVQWNAAWKQWHFPYNPNHLPFGDLSEFSAPITDPGPEKATTPAPARAKGRKA